MKKITLRKWDVAACTYDELLEAMDVGVLGHRARGYASHKSLSAAK